MTQRRRRSALWFAGVVVVLLGTGTGSASAEQPFDVTGPVTGPGGVLGDRADDVHEALDRFFDATGQAIFASALARMGSSSTPCTAGAGPPAASAAARPAAVAAAAAAGSSHVPRAPTP